MGEAPGEAPGKASTDPLLGPRYPPPERPRGRPKGRPAFGLVIGAIVLTRFGREVAERVAVSRYGFVGFVLVAGGVLAVVLVWRGVHRARVRRQGGFELTPEDVRGQIESSGLGPPAFVEDGTVLGASLLVLNQRTKLVEAVIEHDVFGSDGERLGAVRQIGQSRAKLAVRLLTSLDQFFTHHLDIVGGDGRPVLRLTRPAKLFRSKVHVFDGSDRYLGTIQQLNVLWKINFELRASNGQVVGFLRAQNVRAWDFHVYDWYQREVATVVKSWEGWARTAFTRADRYVVRVHEPLPEPLRPLTIAAALAVDVALKQDPRGLG
jgi:Scramblase